MSPSAADSYFTRYAARLARGDLATAMFTYLALVGFYLLTATSNYAETDDVFAFAYRAENFPLDYISDPRLMLYHILMRGLYLGVSMLQPSVSALVIMRGVALLSAPLVLLVLVRLLARDFSLRSVSAVIAAAFMACSYGFWRYAVEADVYIPASLLIVLTLSLLLAAGPKPGDRRLVGASMLAAISVLFYQPAVLAVFFAFPLLLLRRDRLPQLLTYLGCGAALVLAAYSAAYLYSQDAPLNPENMLRFLSQRSNEFMVPPLSPAVFIKSIIKSGFALTHDLVSANWMFGIETLSQGIQRIFSSNVIEEEVFAARSAGWMPYLSFLWLAALALVLFRLLRCLPAMPWARLRERKVQVCLLWLGINAAVIGRLNPAGIEAWLMVLMPLFILLAIFLFEPLSDANQMPLLAAALALYLGHNLTGGMAIMWDQEGDYDFVKGRWVIEQARADDLIIVVDDAGLAELLRYRSDAQVDLVRASVSPRIAASLLTGEAPEFLIPTYGRDFRHQDVHRHILRSANNDGAIFVFDEFFTWDTEYRKSYGPQTEQQRRLLMRLRQAAAIERHESAVGASYRFKASGLFGAAAAQ